MGWLDRRREGRAEAAVRRQLAALEGGRGVQTIETTGLPEGTDPPLAALLPPEPDVALAVNLPDLLAECARADALAGSHGGFVATARIREILRGAA